MVALVLVSLAGALALLVLALTENGARGFGLPVADIAPAAKVRPGGMACQRPVTAEEEFELVRLTPAAAGRVRIEVAVLSLDGGDRAPASGELVVAGRKRAVQVRLDRRVRQEERFALCVRNKGGGVVALYGSDQSPDVAGEVSGDGALANHDLTLAFSRGESRNLLAEVPEMFERAALFRPGFVGAWTFWLLLLAVMVGVPALLSAALREADRS